MDSGEDDKKHVKRLRKALRNTDPCLAMFYLKSTDSLMFYLKNASPVLLNEETMNLLLAFIKNFISCDFPVKTEFGEFITDFMKNITTESLKTHISCLSLLYMNGMIVNKDEHLQHYRSLFSYSKIYSIFKEQMKNIFTEGLESEFFEYLVLLLDNSKLVYKHILPVIKKITAFVDQNLVDKSIVDCCILLRAITRIYPSNLNSTFVISILTYLVDLLLDSQNFIFIDLTGSKIILETIKVQADMIIHSKDVNVDMKKLSLGLMRKLVEAIKKYRNSTVYEETMVVVSAIGCLENIFRLFIKFENRNIDFIDSDLLNFVVFERTNAKSISKIESGHNSKLNFERSSNNLDESKNKKLNFERSSNDLDESKNLKLDFERPFKNHYNAHHQTIRDEFIVNKYRFLDLFWGLTKNIDEKFKRIEFYNDLTKIEDSHRLFAVINNIKCTLDWSDLIVFACNAPNRENYIPSIFDQHFLKNQGHKVFLEIFLKNISSSRRNLVYFTKYCIDVRMMDLLARLYLIDLDRDENPCKKKREMILRFLAGIEMIEENISEETIGDMNDVDPVKSKEVKVTTKEHPINDNLIEKIKKIEIREIVDVIEANSDNKDKDEIGIVLDNLSESAEIGVFVETLTNELVYLHQNLIPLFIILMYKKVKIEIVLKFLEKVNLKMNRRKDDNQYRIESFVSVFSIYCSIYKINYFKDHEIVTNKDLFITTMCINLGNFDPADIDIMKIRMFDVMMRLADEDVLVGKEIYVFENEENSYIKELKHIIKILRS